VSECVQQFRLYFRKSKIQKHRPKSKSTGQKQKQFFADAGERAPVTFAPAGELTPTPAALAGDARRALATSSEELLLLLAGAFGFWTVLLDFGRCFWFWTFGNKVGTAVYQILSTARMFQCQIAKILNEILLNFGRDYLSADPARGAQVDGSGKLALRRVDSIKQFVSIRES
jgi:hypothetical protein